ncbi:hypothetical protein BN946_scf184999.g50 [Trametes cinnabarina]|uniref:Uncharacterized protein n=1 Tax=Pycnoporus cinnabarinus TaxID=5643 RepID=A0A060SDR4_PYCCI|nr:hypothetical protein BN946_scf184999.g50 [Trametes cinnabarina]
MTTKSSAHEQSPTLMQMMEPVLASWYEDSRLSTLPSTAPNTSRDKSATSTESTSHSYQTPMTSPMSPAVIGAYPESRSSMPFTMLRKQLGVSATSSILSISATSNPSPASAYMAVFHSPMAPRLPVPKPVYTPSIRPESCAVLPVDWRSNADPLNTLALLQSPTHCSPAPSARVGLFDVLVSPGISIRPVKSPKVSFSPKLGPTPSSPAISQGAAAGPMILKSVLKDRLSAGGTTSLAIPSSLRNSVSFSMISLEVPRDSITIGDTSVASLLSVCSAARSNTEGKNRKSWDLTDLMSNGQLDVDAVTQVLGLGLGIPPVSRSSVGSVGSDALSAALSISILSPEAKDPAVQTDWQEPLDDVNGVDSSGEYDVEQYATGWGSPRLDEMRASMHLLTHVHGAPLCVIPEETRSDVCSVAGSVHAGTRPVSQDEDGLLSMELVSAIIEEGEEGADVSLKVDEG